MVSERKRGASHLHSTKGWGTPGSHCSSGCCKVFCTQRLSGMELVQTKGIQQLQKFAWSWAHPVKGAAVKPYRASSAHGKKFLRTGKSVVRR